jgi:iron(III) transport system ATP-binding protein
MNGTADRPARQPYLELRGISKLFGAFAALSDIDLDVEDGEFLCFLGPSGCGKTTLLRVIAGLETQSRGEIRQDGRDISRAPAAKRDFGIVFQSYALFPNLTVRENVAYGLRNRRAARAEVDGRVRDLLQMVGLPDAQGHFPAQLSGGQQQRVALARALATSPRLLLLDEPLSALDAKVRKRLRLEIGSLQRQLGITTIMVTHDQEEALSMADRIVIMKDGRIEQSGDPVSIYSHPRTSFVADFIGAACRFDGMSLGGGRIRVGAHTLDVDACAAAAGTPVQLAIRPEEIVLQGEAAENMLRAEVGHVEFLGGRCIAQHRVQDFDGAMLRADVSSQLVRSMGLAQGAPLDVRLPKRSLHVFPHAG